jgi:Leucine-rich repeat (LRR) protein
MWDISKLGWVDLSHNLIERLDFDFSNLPNLKSLYLHCNYLYDLKDLLQLSTVGIRK